MGYMGQREERLAIQIHTTSHTDTCTRVHACMHTQTCTHGHTRMYARTRACTPRHAAAD